MSIALRMWKKSAVNIIIIVHVIDIFPIQFAHYLPRLTDISIKFD